MSTATARFDFPPLAEVRRNFRVKWYRCPIDPAVLRGLMQRSDLQGAFQALGHLGLFAVTGAVGGADADRQRRRDDPGGGGRRAP